MGRVGLDQFSLEAEASRCAVCGRVLGLPLVAVSLADLGRHLAHGHRPTVGTEHPLRHQSWVVVGLPHLFDGASDDARDAHLGVGQDLEFGPAAGGERREVSEHLVDLAHGRRHALFHAHVEELCELIEGAEMGGGDQA